MPVTVSRLYMALACIGVGSFLGCGGCVVTVNPKGPVTPASTGGPTEPVAPPGQLPHNGMPKNGISAEALRANSELLERLKVSKLNSLKLDDVKPFSSQDPTLEPRAVQLMHYIVSFALKEGQKVSARVGNKRYEWSGHIGACAGGGPLGDWFNDLPSPECLQAVSAGVLARVNALNKVVVVSMRGPGDLVALHDKVPAETRSRERNTSTGEATVIESFAACNPVGRPDQATSDCGWSARYVGQCLAQRSGDTAPRTVKLKLNSAHARPSPVFVRVCAGIHGCNHVDYAAADPRSRYIKHIKSDALDVPGDTVEFTCPANGPAGTRLVDEANPTFEQIGYFSVMLSERNFAVDVKVEGSGDGVRYPAKEAELFRYREGAFYGNIFDSVPSDARPDGVLFDKQYACYGEDWDQGAANLADRLCALPAPDAAAQCFVHEPKACSPFNGNPGACTRSAGGRRAIYTPCDEAGANWRYPVTVYLNHPCDLRSDSGCSSSFKGWVIDRSLR
ncbi:hypothetical protein [Sorangium sp. So ce204]|uniref:hypothetical protein n=1 Tax=Sorangium sp. So ce204 TaxID=3133288 RepID=UPI003F63FE47